MKNLLFISLFVVAIIGLFVIAPEAGAHRGWGGRGYWGRGYYGPGYGPYYGGPVRPGFSINL